MNIEILNSQLSIFESSHKQLDELEISNFIKSISPQEDNICDSDELEFIIKSERIAFDFLENYPEKNSNWGTYFGPMYVLPDEDGVLRESPSISLVTNEMLGYWKERSVKTTHSVFKARYLGLLWDFTEKVTGQVPEYKIVQSYIDSLIEVAEKILQSHTSYIRTKLERAIQLSLQINDKKRLTQSRDATLDYYRKILDEGDKNWSFAFDLLLINKNVKPTSEQETEIIDILKLKLANLELANKEVDLVDPWKYESAVLPLAKYFHRTNNQAELKRVIGILDNAFESSSEKVDAMLSSSWLEHILKIYTNYGLEDDKKRVLVKLKNIGTQVNEGMNTTTVESQIRKDEIKQFVDFFIDKDFKTALIRLAAHFIPNKNQVIKQVQELSKLNPLLYLISRQIHDEKGRILATVGAISEDLNSHVVLQISQNMQFEQLYLRHVFLGVHEKFNLTTNKIIDFLYQSPIFTTDKKEIITRGVQAYLDEDYLISMHLLIPQIEDVIRNLFELRGIPIIIQNQEGGFNLKTLGRLVNEPLFLEAFGEDFKLYFKVIFIDNKGWNLRDNLCHGLILPESFHVQYTDRIIQTLLYFGLVRVQKFGTETSEEE